MPDGSAPYAGTRAHRRRLIAEARRRERRLSGRDGLKPAAERLIFDPIEPRVLLNADTLAVQVASVSDQAQAHDLLVRMIDDTVSVGTQTQTVQRVQVVDQTSGGAILAMGDLSEISVVAIAVTKGADTITVDLDSFGANVTPKISVAGDGLTALAIGHTAGSVAWQANGDGSGSPTGAGANVSFTGVASLSGNGTADVLNGPAADTTWQISGPGSGSLEATAGGPVMNFQGFNALAGAANNQDTFDALQGGAMPGGVDGGAGGYDSLAYVGGKYNNVIAVATGLHSPPCQQD